MTHTTPRQLDIYSELCPASSATIIGAGLVAVTMGSPGSGLVVVVAGIAIGIAGPLSKMFWTQKERPSKAS